MSLPSLGEAILDLAADGQKLVEDIDKSKPAVLGALDTLGKAGGMLLAAGLMIAVTALVAITGMIWDAGQTMDAAYDKIAVSTGATGKELDALQKSFDSVFQSVPTDADSAAAAVAGLNQRLGMTGGVLEATSMQLLEMTRLTGGDLQTNIAAFTRMIQDAGIKTEDAAGAMDAVFVASQKTGIGTSRLMELLAQFGVPMRQLGFSFEESAALMGKWEKEGVNTELVLGSLKIATAKYAKEGIPLRKGLDATMKSIKNAKTESEALNIAIEVFGAKNGPDMAAAIRENRFELGDLVGTLGSAEGAIMDTAEATMDWGERWTMFKNRMTVALGPAGQALMTALNKALGALEDLFARDDVQAGMMAIVNGIVWLAEAAANYLPVVIDWIFKLIDFLKNNQAVVVAILAVIGAALLAFGINALIALAPMLPALLLIVLVLALIGLAAYFLYRAWTENWWGIREKTAAVIAFIQKVVNDGIAFIQKVFKDAMNFIHQLNNGELGWLSALWKNTWAMIQTVVSNGVKIVMAVVKAFQALMRGDFYAFGQQLRVIWDTMWNSLVTIFTTIGKNLLVVVEELAKNIIALFIDTDWGQVGEDIMTGLANGISSGAGWLYDAVENVVEAMIETILGIINGAGNEMAKLTSELGLASSVTVEGIQPMRAGYAGRGMTSDATNAQAAITFYAPVTFEVQDNQSLMSVLRDLR